MTRSRTLGELKASGYQVVTVKEEMRRNLVRKRKVAGELNLDWWPICNLRSTGVGVARKWWHGRNHLFLILLEGKQ